MKSSFVTIAVFNLPQETYVAKLKLESEGISIFLKDELTIQTDNFLSQAMGGVKLQVLNKDVDRAREILVEGGFIQPEYNTENKYLNKIDRITKRIPFMSKSLFVVRLLVFVSIVFATIVGLLIVFTYPYDQDRLVEQRWCITEFYINESPVEMQEVEGMLTLRLNDGCDDWIEFTEFRTFKLSNGIEGKWHLKDGMLELLDRLSHQSLSGDYSLEFDHNLIIMKTPEITIVGKKYAYSGTLFLSK